MFERLTQYLSIVVALVLVGCIVIQTYQRWEEEAPSEEVLKRLDEQDRINQHLLNEIDRLDGELSVKSNPLPNKVVVLLYAAHKTEIDPYWQDSVTMKQAVTKWLNSLSMRIQSSCCQPTERRTPIIPTKRYLYRRSI